VTGGALNVDQHEIPVDWVTVDRDNPSSPVGRPALPKLYERKATGLKVRYSG
jgi:hypothetical protein